MAAESVGSTAPVRPWYVRGRHNLWRLLTATVGGCMRYRVTGLAAEAAFFAILSLPPLIFGLAGSIGYVVKRIDPPTLNLMRDRTIEYTSKVLTDSAVHNFIKPTLDLVLKGQRVDVISIGFILALWSGSRALNVFVDTITIMYGLGGRRGIVRTRVLSFSLYAIGLLVGAIVLPLVVAGPEIVNDALPSQVDWLNQLYWPVVVVLSVAFLMTLYHLSVPVRTRWRYEFPGAVLSLAMWILGSWLLRRALQTATTSIYGPLSAPIAILLWLYLISLAVLIGAALNASFDRLWPASETARARLEIVRRLRRKRAADQGRAEPPDSL
jgi:membrane protein